MTKGEAERMSDPIPPAGRTALVEATARRLQDEYRTDEPLDTREFDVRAVLRSLRLADDEGAVGAASNVLAPLLYGRDAERSMASDAAARKVIRALDRYLTGESTEPEAT